jgi:pre-rRNA-processing protein TSR1
VLQVHCPAYGALFPLLDLAQSSDFLLFFLSASHSIDPGSWGETALRILQAQGMPSVQCAVPTLLPDDAPAKAGARQRASQGARSSLLSFAQYFAPTLEKVHALDDRAERGALFRTLATSTPRRVAWRDARAWGIVEEAAFDAPAGAESGTLSVETWVRGAPLSAQRLVHLPDFGDFIVRRIVAAPLSKRHEKRAKKGDAEMADAEPQQLVLDEREEGYADDLVETNEPDAMAAEQTWPTEEEMADAPAAAAMTADEAVPDAAPGTTPASISKIAAKAKRGEASRRKYEAAWIVESDDEELDEEDGEMMETDSAAAAEEQAALLSEDENFDDEDEDFDDEEDAEALAAYQAQRAEDKAKRARDDEDAKFPDEVDTPLAIPARQRFARYRGLRSLRTSEWDAYEDLPLDYARIFQFDDYRRTRRRVEGEALEEGIAVGQRVKLVLENVPRAAAARAGAFGMPERDSRPVLFGLLRHEHKMSVLNFTVARNTEYEGSVKSKVSRPTDLSSANPAHLLQDPLVLCLGPRRLRVNPIWSEHNPANNGSRGTNNVHRFSRFLRGGSGAVSVGTVLAPVTFGGANVPAVLLRERRLDGEMGHDQRGVGANQMPHLVGSGSLLDAAPTRINVKRIVLTGHPFKVHKKTATIRWMFFNSCESANGPTHLPCSHAHSRRALLQADRAAHQVRQGRPHQGVARHARLLQGCVSRQPVHITFTH